MSNVYPVESFQQRMLIKAMHGKYIEAAAMWQEQYDLACAILQRQMDFNAKTVEDLRMALRKSFALTAAEKAQLIDTAVQKFGEIQAQDWAKFRTSLAEFEIMAFNMPMVDFVKLCEEAAA